MEEKERNEAFIQKSILVKCKKKIKADLFLDCITCCYLYEDWRLYQELTSVRISRRVFRTQECDRKKKKKKRAYN